VEEYRAQVLCRSPEWDLALLTVEDDAFWEGVEVSFLPSPVDATLGSNPLHIRR
jgi:hypothetical protein